LRWLWQAAQEVKGLKDQPALKVQLVPLAQPVPKDPRDLPVQLVNPARLRRWLT
jgi:hypothetical protein